MNYISQDIDLDRCLDNRTPFMVPRESDINVHTTYAKTRSKQTANIKLPTLSLSVSHSNNNRILKTTSSKISAQSGSTAETIQPKYDHNCYENFSNVDTSEWKLKDTQISTILETSYSEQSTKTTDTNTLQFHADQSSGYSSSMVDGSSDDDFAYQKHYHHSKSSSAYSSPRSEYGHNIPPSGVTVAPSLPIIQPFLPIANPYTSQSVNDENSVLVHGYIEEKIYRPVIYRVPKSSMEEVCVPMEEVTNNEAQSSTQPVSDPIAEAPTPPQPRYRTKKYKKNKNDSINQHIYYKIDKNNQRTFHCKLKGQDHCDDQKGDGWKQKDRCAKHIETVHKKITFTCHLCHKKCKRKDNLNQHMKRSHGEGSKDFKCPVKLSDGKGCPYRCQESNELKRHLAIKKHNLNEEEIERYMKISKRENNIPSKKTKIS